MLDGISSVFVLTIEVLLRSALSFIILRYMKYGPMCTEDDVINTTSPFNQTFKYFYHRLDASGKTESG